MGWSRQSFPYCVVDESVKRKGTIVTRYSVNRTKIYSWQLIHLIKMQKFYYPQKKRIILTSKHTHKLSYSLFLCVLSNQALQAEAKAEPAYLNPSRARLTPTLGTQCIFMRPLVLQLFCWRLELVWVKGQTHPIPVCDEMHVMWHVAWTLHVQFMQ